MKAGRNYVLIHNMYSFDHMRKPRRQALNVARRRSWTVEAMPTVDVSVTENRRRVGFAEMACRKILFSDFKRYKLNRTPVYI